MTGCAVQEGEEGSRLPVGAGAGGGGAMCGVPVGSAFFVVRARDTRPARLQPPSSSTAPGRGHAAHTKDADGVKRARPALAFRSTPFHTRPLRGDPFQLAFVPPHRLTQRKEKQQNAGQPPGSGAPGRPRGAYAARCERCWTRGLGCRRR